MALKWSPADSHWWQVGQISGHSLPTPNTAMFLLSWAISRVTVPWPYAITSQIPKNCCKYRDPDSRTLTVIQDSQLTEAGRQGLGLQSASWGRQAGRGLDSSQSAKADREGLQLQPASWGRQAGRQGPPLQLEWYSTGNRDEPDGWKGNGGSRYLRSDFILKLDDHCGPFQPMSLYD